MYLRCTLHISPWFLIRRTIAADAEGEGWKVGFRAFSLLQLLLRHPLGMAWSSPVSRSPIKHGNMHLMVSQTLHCPEEMLHHGQVSHHQLPRGSRSIRDIFVAATSAQTASLIVHNSLERLLSSIIHWHLIPTTTTATMAAPPFFRLPTELRNMIYELALPLNHTLVHFSMYKVRMRPYALPALYRTNRLLR